MNIMNIYPAENKRIWCSLRDLNENVEELGVTFGCANHCIYVFVKLHCNNKFL